MDVLLHYFKQNKSEHIFLYFIATLNKFSPILKYVNQSDMINNHNKMQKEYDSDYLALDIKEGMYSKKNRIVQYNDNNRMKRPNYYYPSILSKPQMVKKISNYNDTFLEKEFIVMYGEANIQYNVYQTNCDFLIILNNIDLDGNYIIELCFYNTNIGSEVLNDIYQIDLKNRKFEYNSNKVYIQFDNDNQILLLSLKYDNIQIYEKKYILMSIIVKERLSDTLNQIIVSKGWYTSPVKYYIA